MPLILLLSTLSFASDAIVLRDLTFDKKALDKLNAMSDEIYQKTGVRVYLVAVKSFNGISLESFRQKECKKRKDPKIILLFSKEDKKVDICNTPSLDDKFDKEQILSPFSWSGSIIPLLTAKSKRDMSEPALLNGFADICEQVADSYDIEFKNAIGNANRDTFYVIKAIFYGMLLYFGFLYIRKRVRKNEQ